ncbi:MAG: SIR2 family protein [Acidimicrobiales bacterium]
MLQFFGRSDTVEALQFLARQDQLTVFVGAGASKEAALPTWAELVKNLVSRAVTRRGWITQAEWLAERVLENDLLGAAERVEVLLPQNTLADAIRKQLYQGTSPAAFQPGPLTQGVAEIQAAFGGAARVVTTNYDQLLLTALRDRGLEAHSYCCATNKPGIVHLHGVLGYEEPDDGKNEIVLTERHFLAPSSGWRTEFLRDALSRPCLFLGASMTDLNILRSLHAQQSVRRPLHRVLFVRDPALDRTDLQRRAALEQIETKRWRRLGVVPLFADNFADVAQFAFELAQLRRGPTESLSDRFTAWYQGQARSVLSQDPSAFRRNQIVLSDELAKVVAGIRADFALQGEVLSLGVCVLVPPAEDCEHQERAVNWVVSDRAMTTPETIEYLRLAETSAWTVVKAICAGASRLEQKAVYASRWHLVWAEPVFMPFPRRMPVGAVALSSRAPLGSSLLPVPDSARGLDPDAYSSLRRAIIDAGQAVLVNPLTQPSGMLN